MRRRVAVAIVRKQGNRKQLSIGLLEFNSQAFVLGDFGGPGAVTGDRCVPSWDTYDIYEAAPSIDRRCAHHSYKGLRNPSGSTD